MTLPSRRSLILGAGAAIIARPARALIVLRNPLAFPGGIASPGFNPGHVAGQLVRYAAVARSGNLVSTQSGKSATLNGTITSAIDPYLGPSVFNTTSTAFLSVAAANEQPTAVTVAAMLTLTAITGTQVIFNNNGSTANTAATLLYSGAGTVNLQVAGSAIASAGLTANNSYFIAVSYNGVALNSVVLNISTGKLVNVVTSSTHAFGTPTLSQYDIAGTSTATNQLNGRISAIMYSLKYMSQAQLQQWAAAPWDFWYPPTTQSLMVSGLASPAGGASCTRLALTGAGC